MHPYVNGNGRIGRLALWAVLARYGLRPTRWTVEPPPQLGPCGRSSADACIELVGAWLDGKPEALEGLLVADVEPISAPAVTP